MKRSLFLLALAACSLATAASAQQRPARTALDALTPDARARVTLADTTLRFRTRRVPGGRVDVDAGVRRAAYRLTGPMTRAATPEATARALMTATAPDFGWTPEAPDLALLTVEEGRYNTHVVFQQTLAGVPVYGRRVKVSLDRDGRPTMVLSGYAPHLAAVRRFDPRPALDAATAEAQTQALVSAVGARTSAPELVVYPTAPPRLAWRLLAWPQDAPAEWEVLIDAHTGEVIRLFDQSTHAHGEVGPAEATLPSPPEATPRPAPAAAPGAVLPQPRRVQGSGLAFDPDPITTAGVEYGGAYVDADDADVEALNAQRQEVLLPDITQGTDGLYRLEGPFVIVDGSSAIGGTTFVPPAEADPNGFRYGRSDDAFEAVMAYYHIDTSQRYIQSLDVGRAIQQGPLRINPHGLGLNDDSKYYLGLNAIALGDGGIDDAEDADVIWHEYGHALLEDSAPGLLNSPEGRALHEGWADYWAASYSRGLIDAGKVPNRDWRKVFTWDGNETWNGRLLNNLGIYPQDTRCDDGSCGSAIYQDGLLWATTLMEIYDQVGRAVIDRLAVTSLGYLLPPTTFADAAAALIQADLDLYDGAHLSVLLDKLDARGLVDASVFGPVVFHQPLPYLEQTGGSITVTVEAMSVGAPISSVAFLYSLDGGPFETLVLTAQSGDRYEGAFAPPAGTAEVAYYIEAVDTGSRQTRLPANAPQQTFRFGVGPDTEAPVITHEPIQQAALQAWPARVLAEVDDNQGVDSVWVTFTIEAPGGAVLADGSFGLLRAEGGVYENAFPVDATLLQDGSTVRYRLYARDVATGANEARFPTDGTFSFPIVVEGVLAVFDFETAQGVQATGVWRRGAPTYGLRVAHSGQQVWATETDDTYPGSAQQATLDLPSFNLADVAQAFLVFWHWYDFEHTGTVLPDQPSAESFWDGGNVKVSLDSGASWAALVPEGGYNGTLAAGTGNPLGGQPGFGGYSFGWRRVIVPLPTDENVRLRFDFGSDASNEDTALFFAGWYLDDVRVTTQRPVDTVAPVLVTTPPAQIELDAGQTPPPLVVTVQDNVGPAAVQATFEVVQADGTRTPGTVRLAMDPADLSRYEGVVVPTAALTVGDRIEYRLTVRDFDGNTIVFPAIGQPPLRIDYRLTEQVSALPSARATGTWQRQGSGWAALATGSAALVERSALVLEPLDLPTDASALGFVVQHRFQLGDGLGGNLKVSTNDGASWTVLEPEGGYGAVFAAGPAHPMDGEPVFRGDQAGAALTTRFDLAAYAGQQIRLRLDLGATRALGTEEFWRVEQGTLAFSTLGDGFDIPRTLALLPNFPDPFSDNTTVSYTLPERLPVQLGLYNILGQRVAVLVDAEQDAGTYTLTLSRGSLASGVYLLRLLAGGTQKVERLVMTR